MDSTSSVVGVLFDGLYGGWVNRGVFFQNCPYRSGWGWGQSDFLS